MSEERKGDLVPVPNNSPLVPTGPQRYNIFQEDGDSADFWTTLNPDIPEQAFYLQEAMSGEAEDINKWINKVFNTTHVLTHPFQKVNADDGLIISGLRCVMIGPDGKMTAFTGTGARRSMRRLAVMAGEPPWIPFLPIEVTQLDLDNAKRMHVLRIPKGFDLAKFKSTAKKKK